MYKPSGGTATDSHRKPVLLPGHASLSRSLRAFSLAQAVERKQLDRYPAQLGAAVGLDCEMRRLFHDKWAVLCRDKVGRALTECEDIVDAATARDDNAGCKAARARATSPTGQNTFGSLGQIAQVCP